jgi:two-component system chemotaxis response regulator CheB
VPEASQQPDRAFDVVAVASSAGGITALGRLLSTLPADLPVPVLMVQHLDPRHHTLIADVLGNRSRLPVKLADDGEHVKPGVVYIAPPDHHLLVDDQGVLALSKSKLVHFVRPSTDLLFESVAGAYGDRAIACVLTGSGADGSMGVTAIRMQGGTVIVEDPDTAQFRGMPDSAIASGQADFVLPLDEIAAVITGLVEQPRSH